MTQSSEIPCAFDGNPHRIDICQGRATVFFRSAQGTIWPLCKGCSDRHKELMVQLVSEHRVGVPSAVGAVFDVPIDDFEMRQTFDQQDPARIRRLIAAADAQALRQGRR